MITLLDIFSTGVFGFVGAKLGYEVTSNLYLSLFSSLLTGLGGGTIRDLILLNSAPFWLHDHRYIMINILFALVYFNIYLGE